LLGEIGDDELESGGVERFREQGWIPLIS
jgi:hypothetical protein